MYNDAFNCLLDLFKRQILKDRLSAWNKRNAGSQEQISKEWREKIYNKNRVLLPYIEKAILRITAESREGVRRHESNEIHDINAWLRELELFIGGVLPITASDGQIKDLAELKAKGLERDFFKWRRELQIDLDKSLEYIEQQVKAFGIELPEGFYDEDENKDIQVAALARVFDPKWWRRKLRRRCAVAVESFIRECGGVNRKAGIYCSDFSVSRRFKQKERNQDLLDNLIAENNYGQAYVLGDLAQLGVSNPVMRRLELMARVGGFERLANRLGGYSCQFLTITCPSKFHAYHHWGDMNPKWNHSTPKDAQEYLCKVWARVRAEWDRNDIRAFGLRVAEPHHDGTPHWHMVLFFREDQVDDAIAAFEAHATQEDSAELERAGKDVRFKAVSIDPEKGTATGYVVKYVCKNIDGEGVEFDVEKDFGDPIEMASRIEAWASVWGIRQFQQIGGPSVTVWRELRRLKEVDGISMEEFEAIRAAADQGDWMSFCKLMGGPTVKRNAQPLRAYMILKEEINEYGERIQKLVGLVFGGCFSVPTRFFEWTIRKVKSEAERALVRANAPPMAA